MSGLLGMIGLGGDKAKQEELGKQMQSLSEQIAALQQQGKGKDSQIEQLQKDLAQAQALSAASDQAKKQFQDLQSQLAVAQADKQADDIMLQTAQKQISDLQAQLQQVQAAAAAAPAAFSGLAVGAAAWVRQEGGKGLRRRSAAGTSSEVLDTLAPGTEVALLEGPSEADGYHWWKIKAGDGREGWVAGEELVTKPE